MRATLAIALIGTVVAAGVALAADPKAAPSPSDERAAKRISSSPNYVYGPTMVTTLLNRQTDGRQSITVEMGWDVPDAALRARMGPMRVRLNDGLRAALSDFGVSGVRPGAAPNLTILTQHLQRATDAVLGQAGARVLLANVMILQR